MIKKDFIQQLDALLLRKAPSTSVSYRRILTHYAKFLVSSPSLPSSTTAKVQAFLLETCRDKSASTVNQSVAALSWYYRTAFNERLDVRRFRAKTGRRLPELLDLHDIQTMLTVLPPTLRLMGLLFAGSGLTLAQARSLREADYDDSVVTVHGRMIPVCHDAVHLIAWQMQWNDAQRQKHQVAETWLFPGRHKPTQSIAPNAFSHACRIAGLDRRVTPSNLRAAFIVAILRSGHDGLVRAHELTGLSAAQLLRYERALPRARSPLDR